MGISEADAPYTGPYSVDGNGKHKGPTAEALKRAMKRAQFGFKSKDLGDLTQTYNDELEKALDKWNPGANGYGDNRWKAIRNLKCPAESPHQGEWALDEYACRLLREEAVKDDNKVPALGPVFSGGKKVTDHDLTHATSGISLFPAFDDAFSQGKTIIAPENIEVYKASSSNPGDACYAEGDSGMRYWFGHLAQAPAVGAKIKKGATVGKTCANSVGGGPHVHIGVNVEKVWGSGRQLQHHTNYTHGAPTIGKQLADGP